MKSLFLVEIGTNCIYGKTTIDGSLTNIFFPLTGISYISVVQDERNPLEHTLIVFLNNGAVFNFKSVREEQIKKVYEMLNIGG